MVIGELESTLKNGNSFKMPFTSRLVFRLDARGDAQATLCEVWAVSNSLMSIALAILLNGAETNFRINPQQLRRLKWKGAE